MGLKGAPFKNEFGIQNNYGIPKPVYRVFQTLHEAGDQRLDVQGSHPNAEVLALTDGRKATIIVYNHDIERRTVQPEEIRLTLSGKISSIRKAVIDEENCNPKAAWEAMGSPKYPTKAQLDAIRQASRLVYQTVETTADTQQLEFTAQPESVTIFEVCYR